jgi:hypothetical protein
MISIVSLFAAFWSELNDPSTYRDDPYGAAVNQLGHVALGAFTVSAVCVIWQLVFGEMPYRVPTWLILTAGYAVLIEWAIQGWSRADSIIDTGFVALGFLIPLASFKEVGRYRDGVTLYLDAPVSGACLAATAVMLAVYVAPRAVRKYRGR